MAARYWRKPLDLGQIKAPHGHVYIIAERCKGCEFCVRFCPRQVLEMSDQSNSKGYHVPRVVNGDRCLSCGLCEMLCPEFAIYRVEEERVVEAL